MNLEQIRRRAVESTVNRERHNDVSPSGFYVFAAALALLVLILAV